MKRKQKFIPYRRKREGKTDYRQRLELLKSRTLRLVVRRSLRHITAQLVEYHETGDKTLITAHSKELKKHGWDGYTRNTPAGYLVGYLCGIKAKQKKIDAAVLDMGLYSSRKGTVLFSVLKGCVDAGLNVPHDTAIFPDEGRVQGKHITDDMPKKVELVKSNIQKVK